MQSEVITIFGQVPAKANNYQVTANGIVKGSIVKAYEKAAILQLNARWHYGTITERFTLQIDIYYASERYDLDNSLKTFLDILQYAKIIANDSQCYHIEAHKHIDKRAPRVCFRLITAENRLF